MVQHMQNMFDRRSAFVILGREIHLVSAYGLVVETTVDGGISENLKGDWITSLFRELFSDDPHSAASPSDLERLAFLADIPNPNRPMMLSVGFSRFR